MDFDVVLVDDHSLVLEGLKSLLKEVPGIGNVYAATSGKELLDMLKTHTPSLYIMDLELPDADGFALAADIKRMNPVARIIVCTMHEEVWFIKNLIHCEVDGILFKSVDACKVVEAIRQVLGGGTYYCAYAEQIRSQMKRMDGNHRGELTLRELDVLKRISEGKNTQEIAEELCVSTNTVDTHRRHLMEKLGARNVADLIMTAISRGIIPIRKC